MSISSEIEKLSELHEKGILNDIEFRIAKDKLLNTNGVEGSSTTDVYKIENAAFSWVKLQWASFVFGILIFIFVIFFFLKIDKDFNDSRKRFDDNSKKFDKDFNDRSKQFDKEFDYKRNHFGDPLEKDDKQ